MKLLFKIGIISFLLLSKVAIADGDPESIYADHTDYFNTMNLIQQQPLGAQFLKPIDEKEKAEFIVLFKKENMDKQKARNSTCEKIKKESIIYQGDLRNDKSIIYEIIQSDEFGESVAYFYQLKNNHLLLANFGKLSQETFGDDNELRTPLAPFVKEGKTYLRFFGPIYHGAGYYVSNLRVGSYLWQGNALSNPGPNFSGEELVAEVKPCAKSFIISERKKFQNLYDKHSYQDAFNSLTVFMDRCQNIIWDAYSLLWLQNDLLISLANLKDKKKCQALSQKINDELKNDKKFLYVSKKLQAVTQYNISKCDALP